MLAFGALTAGVAATEPLVNNSVSKAALPILQILGPSFSLRVEREQDLALLDIDFFGFRIDQKSTPVSLRPTGATGVVRIVLPPQAIGEAVHDKLNPYAPPRTKSLSALGRVHTSTMAVEVQVYSPHSGLTGDFAWQTVGAPTVLRPSFGTNTVVTWGGARNEGNVILPAAVTSSTKMRLRISELDHHTGPTLSVTSAMRRPFVTFLPVN